MGKGKRILVKVLPVPVLRPIFTWNSRRKASQFRDRPADDVFTDIFKSNHWGSGESISGVGSETATTRVISQAIPRLVKQYQIKSIFDAPCGDFQWMEKVEMPGVDYTGGDIVAPLVEAVGKRFSTEHRRFMQFDLVTQVPPSVDLIFCRDCFIHLPFEMIFKVLANFKKSGSRYLLTTTYKDWPFNFDTGVGGVRAIDLTTWPFNLPKPLEVIQEETPGDNAAGEPIRCMGLWEISSLQ